MRADAFRDAVRELDDFPPLLHLFQRRHPPDVEFPAARYLRQTEREAQRSIRLRHVVLLLLRVAAVALLVLAAARPVVPVRVGGLHAPTALALVFDHSLSSGAVIGGRRVVDDLAQRARETLREARDADALWLLGAALAALAIVRPQTVVDRLTITDASSVDRYYMWQAGVDMILVGDSVGMVVQGLTNTIPVTVDEICYHGRAVMRGVARAHVVGDMPFMSYQSSPIQAVESAWK